MDKHPTGGDDMTAWGRGPGSVPPDERVYTAPCARLDGCRIASLTFVPYSRTVQGERGGTDKPSLLTADCGWSTRVPMGAEHHLPEAIERWRTHECRRST